MRKPSYLQKNRNRIVKKNYEKPNKFVTFSNQTNNKYIKMYNHDNKYHFILTYKTVKNVKTVFLNIQITKY